MDSIRLRTLLLSLLMLLGFALAAQAQGTQRGKQTKRQEQLRNEYSATLERAATAVGQYVKAYVGVKPRFRDRVLTKAMVYDGITENKSEGYVACTMQLTIPMSNSSELTMSAEIYAYPSYRSVDRDKVKFYMTECNDSFKDATKKSWRNKAIEGILIEY